MICFIFNLSQPATLMHSPVIVGQQHYFKAKINCVRESDRAITCIFLLIPNTCMNALFISKHFDISSLIRASEQALLRESISIRNTYTFMRKMYGKLPRSLFSFPNLWFP